MYGSGAPPPGQQPYYGAPGVGGTPDAAAAYGYPPAGGAMPGQAPPTAAQAAGYAPYDYRGAPQMGGPPAPGYGGYPDPSAGYGGMGPGMRPPGPAPGYDQGPPRGWHNMGPGGRFACVRLRGLPFGVNEGDVAMFLGVDPVDILMTSRDGRSSGEAFVVLSHPGEVGVALSKNKAYMGSRYVEVFEARKLEYYKAVAQAMGGDGEGGRGRGRSPGGRDRSRSPLANRIGPDTRILKLRGLPFSATAGDVVAFFSDEAAGITAPPQESVTIAIATDGRPNGMAFVEFETAEAVTAAIQKDRQMMGSRYVEIFPATADERSRYQ